MENHNRNPTSTKRDISDFPFVEKIISKFCSLRCKVERDDWPTRAIDIVLFCFDDDTFRPVFNNSQGELQIVKEWYDQCQIVMDVETTDLFIPDSIFSNFQLDKIIFEDVKITDKETFLNNDLPQFICKIMSQKWTQSIEKKICLNETQNENDFEQKRHNNVLSQIGVVVPENIRVAWTNNTNNKCKCKCKTPETVPRLNNYDLYPELSFNNQFVAYNTVKHVAKDRIVHINSDDHDCSDVVRSFNDEYSALDGTFADNALHLALQSPSQLKTNRIFVFLNDKYLQTFCLKEPSYYYYTHNTLFSERFDVHQMLKKYQYGFVVLFDVSTKNKDTIDFIYREFDKVYFKDIEHINKKMILLSNYVEYTDKYILNNVPPLSNQEEKAQVEAFVHAKFTITGVYEDQIKVWALYTLLLDSGYIKCETAQSTGFKYRLHKYLKEMGVDKKLVEDSYYYCGIKFNNNVVSERISCNDTSLEQLCQQRIEEKQKEEELISKELDEQYRKRFYM